MQDITFYGPVLTACLAAGGALVGYGMLRQKVAALEIWKELQEIANSRRDGELNKLLAATAANTANIDSLIKSVDRIVTIHTSNIS